jgi:WD40 repeat protein
LRIKQDLTGSHIGAIWTMKMSSCSRLLATAGQDKVVRVWVAVGAADQFKDEPTTSPPAGSSSSGGAAAAEPQPRPSSPEGAVFKRKPFREYEGHTADVLDLSWCYSRNTFLLSSSMDKTVRLWHVSRVECLACFLHEDFVTAITFHPRNDKYFLSGSLDCKLRLWNIPEKKVPPSHPRSSSTLFRLRILHITLLLFRTHACTHARTHARTLARSNVCMCVCNRQRKMHTCALTFLVSHPHRAGGAVE